MRILQLSPQVPLPLDSGGKIGIYGIVKYMSERGHEIHFAAYKKDSNEELANNELKKFSPKLAARPQIVVANKSDILQDSEGLDRFRSYIQSLELKFYLISAATHQGIHELITAIADQLALLPPVHVFEPTYVEPEYKFETAEDLRITVDENKAYVVEGSWMDWLLSTINLTDNESRAFFDRMLRDSGLFERLEEMGIQEGDTVRIDEMEFEYKK